MDLVFKENKLEYLSRVLCETLTQEQTTELIVPDNYPDAQRVVDAWGTAVIRNAQCGEDNGSVSGQVQAGVMFVGEDGKAYTMHLQIPFSVRKEFDAHLEEKTMQCSCTVRSVDARILNSRKLLVRAGISCTIMVYGEGGCTTYEPPTDQPKLQLKQTVLPMCVPLGLGEKTFVLNDELELPAGKPAIGRVLKCVFVPQVLEQRPVGSRGVFKGKLCIHSLYESEDGRLQRFDGELPFSQYVDMSGEFEEKQLETILTLTSAEAQPDGQMECRRLLLSVGFLAQCTAYGQEEFKIVEDAYCTDGEFRPEWKEWSTNAVLDRQIFKESVAASAEGEAASILDTCVGVDEPTCQRRDGKVSIELPIFCDVLYYDSEGQLQSKRLHSTVAMETDLAQNANCRVSGVEISEVFCSAAGGRMEMRCSVSTQVESYAVHHLRSVMGGGIEPLKQEEERPGVILRRVETQCDVWDIAKEARTAIQGIVAANGLQDTQVEPGTMLLIPM